MKKKECFSKSGWPSVPWWRAHCESSWLRSDATHVRRYLGPSEIGRAPLAVLRRAVELDVNFIDTADSYGPHVSEELIAEALFPYRDWSSQRRAAGIVQDLTSGPKMQVRGTCARL